MRLDIAQDCRLNAAVGKIKPRAIAISTSVLSVTVGIEAGINYFAIFSAPSVGMFDLGSGKFRGSCIAMRSEPVDHRASGISQTQELGNFVESFSGRVVASVADVLVGPRLAILGC